MFELFHACGGKVIDHYDLQMGYDSSCQEG